MKKPKIVRLHLLFGLQPGRSRRRGVAIITVLAIISLMTVLVISFFNMAQTQKTSAIGTVEMQRVVTLKDTITNFVIAQIREATTLPGTGGTQTIWISQPGAIRTFHGNAAELNRVYKLYSSPKMMIEGIAIEKSDALINEIQADVNPKWDDRLDQYVDMNRPVVPSDSSKDSSSPTKLQKRLIYPIVDPARYNGQESATTDNTEGFKYGERSLSSSPINGVDAAKGQLAMPVQWIYLLQDGTPGTLDGEGKFFPMGKDSKEPTRANPIVSRIAWWTDDETCKVNVNTASVPIPWDTPRTNSAEDVWYAQHQPVNGECQHYPSHPANTDLSAVFFPGYRYTPDAKVMPIGDMSPLPDDYAKLIWNISPFITETGGSNGGKDFVNIGTAKPVVLDRDDHLYTSFEEMYFKAKNADKNLNRRRDDVSRDDQSGKLLRRLEGSQFFLTTRSSGPEMTIYGTPRLCMFPMYQAVLAEVGKTSGTIPNTVGAFEVTMATNCTIAKKPYYFQRADSPGSRHNNFFYENGGRNADLQTYLRNMTEAIPPGHPELASVFSTLKQKYPGPNRTVADTTNPDFDSSDRTQILLSMLDFIRSTNMTPGYLTAANAYGDGNGQVSGLCGCNVKGDSNAQPKHAAALAYNSTKVTPKGSGRTYGAAEICLFAHSIAVKKGQNAGTIPTGVRLTPGTQIKWNDAKSASLIQVGVLVNAFSPRQGWAPLFAQGAVNISNYQAASGTDPASAPGKESPLTFVGGTTEYKLLTGLVPDGFNSTATTPPPNLVPWAGMVGARLMAWGQAAQVATLDPIVYEGTGAGNTNTIPIQFKWRHDSTSTPSKPSIDVLRIFLYDSGAALGARPGETNVIQGIDLDIGANTIDLDVEYTGKSMDAVMKTATTFPPPKVAVTSFVVPHGDYRLVTTPLRVERGIFVPHGTGKHSVVEPILNGRNVTYVLGNGGKLAPPNEGLLSGTGIPGMDPAYAPHLAPVEPKYLCNSDLGTKPEDDVLRVASKDSRRALRFANGRRDGEYAGFGNPNTVPNRGSSDPLETGDFDNGVGLCPDGAYMNQPDDGDARDATYPYYAKLLDRSRANPASFSPNRLVRSAVEFGSIPSGIQARVPWQTLRFRPDPGMYKGSNQYTKLGFKPNIPDGYTHYFPFSNYCGPKDHLLLDMFWVPVVEPWSISEGFATKGLINLNQQIFPFTYIQRTTALNALLRGERMMAIPDSAANNYKNGTLFPDSNVYRHWINAKETLKQLVDFRWRGQDPEGFTLPFNAFRSASEVCELWLVPEHNGVGSEPGGTWNLNHIIRNFWEQHRLTGDNMRERPYANLYPRLTVRSNVYKVHMIAQTLKKATSNPPETFVSQTKEGADPDLVTAEWRGSALIERVINPSDPELTRQNIDYAVSFKPNTPIAKLDNYYSYRVTEVKQLTE